VRVETYGPEVPSPKRAAALASLGCVSVVWHAPSPSAAGSTPHVARVVVMLVCLCWAPAEVTRPQALVGLVTFEAPEYLTRSLMARWKALREGSSKPLSLAVQGLHRIFAPIFKPPAAVSSRMAREIHRHGVAGVTVGGGKTLSDDTAD
jgi:hypothetical protein